MQSINTSCNYRRTEAGARKRRNRFRSRKDINSICEFVFWTRVSRSAVMGRRCTNTNIACPSRAQSTSKSRETSPWMECIGEADSTLCLGRLASTTAIWRQDSAFISMESPKEIDGLWTCSLEMVILIIDHIEIEYYRRWFLGDILFHFNPRFKEKVIVRNACRNDVWGQEEREGHFPFEKNRGFDLTIINEPYSIQVDCTMCFVIKMMSCRCFRTTSASALSSTARRIPTETTSACALRATLKWLESSSADNQPIFSFLIDDHVDIMECWICVSVTIVIC